MTIFLIWACVSFCMTSTIIFFRPSSVSGGTSYTTGSNNIRMFFYGFLISTFTVTIPIGIILFARHQLPSDNLNYIFDYLSGPWIEQSLLGLAFGSLLAIWMSRAKATSPTDTALSASQKIEAFGLILLLILAVLGGRITSIIREATIDAGPVSVKLAMGGNAPSSVKQNQSPLVISNNPVSNGTLASFSKINQGLGTFLYLHQLMSIDASRVKSLNAINASNLSPSHVTEADRIAVEFDQINEIYNSNFGNLFKCVAYLTNQMDNEDFALSAISSMEPMLAELHNGIVKQTGSNIKNVMEYAQDTLTQISKRSKAAYDRRGVDGSSEASCIRTDFIFETKSFDRTFRAKDRPYVSILYAAALQLRGEEMRAVRILEDWLQLLESAKPSPESATYQKVLRLRIENTQFAILENLFRKNPTQGDLALDLHLKLSQRYIKVLEDLPQIKDRYSKIFINDKINIINDRFSNEPIYRPNCQEKLTTDEFLLNYALFTAKAIVARRATQHSSFADEHFAVAKSYAEEVANADYGCLAEKQDIFSSQSISLEQIKAENYRVFAIYSMSKAASRRPIGNDYKDRSRDDLTIAQDAILLARALLKKRAAPPILADDTPKTLSNLWDSSFSEWRLYSELGEINEDIEELLDQLNTSQ